MATDGAALYQSELEKALERDLAGGFDRRPQPRCSASTSSALPTNLLELADDDRRRIFNLGYFTWVEQQGVSLEDFETRREQTFWRSLLELVPPGTTSSRS